MNIDISKIKTTHWSEILLQMTTNSCYQYAKDISYQEFWLMCQRGDWLLFFITKEGTTPRKLIVKAACQCARLSLPYIKAGELRPLKAIKTTELWLEDKATIKEVKNAAYAVYDVATNVSQAASAAANTVVYSDADAANAAYCAAAYVVDGVVDDVAKNIIRLETANIVRSIIPMPTEVVKQFERLVSMKAFW